ncbi:MAG: hypothetical protein ACP5I4_02590 [Oceanipulchritudo sp.]
MNKKDWVEGILFGGFRLMGAACMLTGLLGVVFQLIDAWYRFDPNYLGNFIAATVLKPLILVAAGLLLHAFSGRLSRRMARRFDHGSK